MKVLVACEFSGAVRDAFADRGHDAWSCDLLESEAPGNHIVGNVLDVLRQGWDLMIAHPPCTYLARSGLHWNVGDPNRRRLTEEALEFVCFLMNAPIPRIAIENPVGCISTRIRKPSQTIHPYQHGDDASKATCLWLKNLPLLRPTGIVAPRFVNGRPRYENQTDDGQHAFLSGRDRQKIRSRTFPGIAAAMAQQWGSIEEDSDEPNNGT